MAAVGARQGIRSHRTGRFKCMIIIPIIFFLCCSFHICVYAFIYMFTFLFQPDMIMVMTFLDWTFPKVRIVLKLN